MTTLLLSLVVSVTCWGMVWLVGETRTLQERIDSLENVVDQMGPPFRQNVAAAEEAASALFTDELRGSLP